MPALKIIGETSGVLFPKPSLTLIFQNCEFTDAQFEALFVEGRTVVANLRQQGFNLLQDFGEDMLLLALSEVCRNLFGELNYQLTHAVYRMLDKEVENGQEFANISMNWS